MTLWIVLGSLATLIGYTVFIYLQGKKAGAKSEASKWLRVTVEGSEASASEMAEVNKRAKNAEGEARANADRPVSPSADVLDMSSFSTPRSTSNPARTTDPSSD